MRQVSLRCLLLLLPAPTWSFSFTVPAGKRECYHETAQMGDRIAGEWRVLNVEGIALDLDVQVRAPRSPHGERHADRAVRLR